MIDALVIPYTQDGILRVLMRIVPGFYILAALYLASIKRRDEDDDGQFELSDYKYSRTVYALLFGAFGGSTYMILNEHTYNWYPLFLDENEWLIISLFTLLAIGITLFYIVIVTQRLQWPWERVCHALHWAGRKLYLDEVVRQIRGKQNK